MTTALLGTILPALALAGSGVALLGTRSRVTGVLMLVTALGLGISVVLRLSGADDASTTVVIAATLLPGAAALMTYPRFSVDHPVEYCAWVVVLVAGGLALVFLSTPANGALMTLPGLAVVAHGWLVLVRGEEQDRLAMLWLGFAAVSCGTVSALLAMEVGPTAYVPAAMLVSLVPIAMALGVRNPGLHDVRSLVVEAVVLIVAGLTYLSLFYSADAVLELAGQDDVSVGVLGFIGVVLAVGVHPLRTLLRGLIDELLFGVRPDPLDAARQVADRIGDDPVLALRAIREALVLPYASIRADGAELAASGTLVTESRRLPLVLGEESMGEVVVGLRPGTVRLSAEDEQVLRLAGPLLAQTIRAKAMADQLAESRQSAITAIEEERRRLRRDLHDGLGPTLSGIAHTSEAARNTIATDPDAAAGLLQHLRGIAADAVGEVRRLVYDMRPPALDELGLVGALRQHLGLVRTPQGTLMQVRVEAGDLPELSAAVEVAIYRIVVEAVANAARHSGSDQASVCLRPEGERLVVTVDDAGAAGTPWTPGVGLSSMRERAAEVGGTFDASPGPAGARVRVELPLQPAGRS